ncbi:hypothetical protein SLEP1_g43925 [Rubroshorea leprosula]|uniref:Uncharacterized protein n=1 Tax=Rubroshorea leprosula TaxID=152421 RepID=A0AAV5LF65_9ROSI|nr:hypothetical protein SLEP1_g43925 [Rubroshorea leprosula]
MQGSPNVSDASSAEEGSVKSDVDFQSDEPDSPQKLRKISFGDMAELGEDDDDDIRPGMEPLFWQLCAQEQKTWIDENYIADSDSALNADAFLDEVNENIDESAEAPQELTLPLLSYQKQWLGWALRQELSAIKGGILADESGMGKTLQAIALVLVKRDDESSLQPTSSKNVVKSTLVICPLIAVDKWVREIHKSTLRGTVKLLVYTRNASIEIEELSDYDFVITTYSVLESEYREMVRSSMPNVGRIASKLSVKENREKLLYSVKWKRVILDKAHFVKDTARALMSLESSYKWVLSGDTLHNRIRELYSIVQFLQIVPYSYFFCRDCNCRILYHSSSDHCLHCKHASARHFCWWDRHVATPLEDNNGAFDNRKRVMILLKHKILKETLLRRRKKGLAAKDLSLPPVEISLRPVTLDQDEENYYESLSNECREKFYECDEIYFEKIIYVHRFGIIKRLLKAVSHCCLVDYSDSAVQRLDRQECCHICHESAEDRVVTSCKHVFCKACLLEYTDFLGEVICPVCHEVFIVDLKASNAGDETSHSQSLIERLQIEDVKTSTKIEALRDEISRMEDSAKGIVFSHFPPFLDLIEYFLQKYNVKCVQLKGSMSVTAQDVTMKKFSEDSDCKILLMSLKDGGLALNLTAASYVFFMDPWWNNGLEKQAQDMVHQIGQVNPVRIVRFFTQNTIEQRILTLQEKMGITFRGTGGNFAEVISRLSEKEMEFLFEK